MIKVLVTSGGTREPIDSVRCITNSSTGATGAYLADEGARHGLSVVCLSGKNAIRPRHPSVRTLTFDSSSDLDRLLQSELRTHCYNAVIHLAAVSDFQVSEILSSKMQVLSPHSKISSQEPIYLKLTPGPKLLSQLRSYSVCPGLKVIGFKLTSGQTAEEQQNAILKIALDSAVDYVVHNDLSQIQEDRHLFAIYEKTTLLCKGQTKSELARCIFQLISPHLDLQKGILP